MPQIYKSYTERSKLGPDTYFLVIVSLSHTFYPMYLKGCPSNLFEKESNLVVAFFYAAIVIIQIIIIKG